MAVTRQSAAPYAPASAIIEVIKRCRSGLPSTIDAEVLGRASISPSLIPRTLQALEALDLINDRGVSTPTLEGLRRAPEGELKQRMAEWLNAAYADVRGFVDPATAEEAAIRDAFRNYNPLGQQPRMVTLFMGLYTAAGVRQSDKKQSAPRPAARTAQQRPRVTPQRADGQSTQRKAATMPTEMPPALAGLLASIPFAKGGWTQQDRDKFITTFETVLDYSFPVVEAVGVEAEE